MGERYLVTASDSIAQLKTILSTQSEVGFDFETSSTDPATFLLAGVGFAIPSGDSFYLPVRHYDGHLLREDEVVAFLNWVLHEQTFPLWAHNASFEASVLTKLGVHIPIMRLRDSMAAYMMHGNPLQGSGLKKLADDLGLEYQDLPWPDMTAVDSNTAAIYCGMDALNTLLVGKHWSSRLDGANFKIWETLESPLTGVIGHMRYHGILIDPALLYTIETDLSGDLAEVETELRSIIGTGINLNSPAQLGRMLFEDLGWWEQEFSTVGARGDWQVNKEVLQKLATQCSHPQGLTVAELLLEHRMLSKLIGTYVANLRNDAANAIDGRVRANFFPLGARTTRFASSNPNLQNIPIRSERGRRLRGAFVAESGWSFLDADYSQIQLRLIAHETQDPMMLKAYRTNIDIHQQTADICGITRNGAKEVNFGLCFNMSPKVLAAKLKISIPAAKKIYDAYHARYREVKKYRYAAEARAAQDLSIKTLIGRRFAINPNQAYMAINSVIQASEAELMKIAMRNVYRTLEDRGYLNKTVRILLTVHDELLFEVHDSVQEEVKTLVVSEMENVVNISVPLVVEGKYGKSWLEAH